MALVSILIKASDLQKLSQLLNQLDEHKIIVKKGSSTTIGEMFARAKSFFEMGQSSQNRRLSDVSR